MKRRLRVSYTLQSPFDRALGVRVQAAVSTLGSRPRRALPDLESPIVHRTPSPPCARVSRRNFTAILYGPSVVVSSHSSVARGATRRDFRFGWEAVEIAARELEI